MAALASPHEGKTLACARRFSNSRRTYSSCRASASWMAELGTAFQSYSLRRGNEGEIRERPAYEIL